VAKAVSGEAAAYILYHSARDVRGGETLGGVMPVASWRNILSQDGVISAAATWRSGRRISLYRMFMFPLYGGSSWCHIKRNGAAGAARTSWRSSRRS